jgi:hypothetical protein
VVFVINLSLDVAIMNPSNVGILMKGHIADLASLGVSKPWRRKSRFAG